MGLPQGHCCMPPPLQAARAGWTRCWCCVLLCVGLCSPESNPYLLQEKDQIQRLLGGLFFYFSIFFPLFFLFWEGYLRCFTKPAFSAVAGCPGLSLVAVFVTHHTQQTEVPSWLLFEGEALWEGELCQPQPN